MPLFLRILFVFVVILFPATCSTALENEPPPGPAPDWVLVSYACDMSLFEPDSTDKVLLEWDGVQYQKATTFERGKGYFTSHSVAEDAAGYCKRISTPHLKHVPITLDQGWNLIGTPVPASITFREFIGPDSADIKYIYKLSGSRFVSVGMGDNIEPGIGYWIYATEPMPLQVQSQWVDMKISFADSKSRIIPDFCARAPGSSLVPMLPLRQGTVKMNASARRRRTGKSIDVAATGGWETSDPGIATVDKGLVQLHAAGLVTITARYMDSQPATYKVRIVDSGSPLCLEMAPGPQIQVDAGTKIPITVYAHFLSGPDCSPGSESDAAVCRVDVSGETVFELDNPGAGTLAGNVFEAGFKEGHTKITMTYGQESTLSMDIAVRAFDWSGFSINTDTFCRYKGAAVIPAGNTLQFEITGKDSQDIIRHARWHVSDQQAAAMDENVLTAKEAGELTVWASIGGARSQEFPVLVRPVDQPVCIRTSPSKDVKLPWRGSITLSARAYYAAGSCPDPDPKTDYCERDITDEISWSMSVAIAGTISNNTFQAENYKGKVQITGTYKGLTGDPFSIFTDNAQAQFLTVTTTGGHHLEHCPVVSSSTDTGCFAIFTGQESVFTVKGRNTGNEHIAARDLTHLAQWSVSDTDIAEFKNNVLIAHSPGLVWVQAHVGDASSPRIAIVVLGDQPMKVLLVGPRTRHVYGETAKIQAGKDLYIYAAFYEYDGVRDCPEDCTPMTGRNVSRDVSWEFSDASLAQLTENTIGRKPNIVPRQQVHTLAPGATSITARYDGITSNSFHLEIWDNEEFPDCGHSPVSIGKWSDGYSNVTLKTCREHTPFQDVAIQYQAFANAHIIDTCLDLYVTDEDTNIVRTLREEGCTSENAGRSLSRQVFGHTVTWDRTDDNGKAVPPGDYYAVARFAILYDPVIRVPFRLLE